MQTNLVSAIEIQLNKRAQLDEALSRFALSAGTCLSLELLADERHESDVSMLAAVCGSIIRDAHAACLDHVKDDTDIGLDDALGLVDRALDASSSIFAAIRVLAGDWANPVLADGADSPDAI